MSDKRKQFPFDDFEPKWQKHWADNQTFVTPNPGDAGFDASKPKFFALDMFPYPSGEGLHVGHPEGYTATDIISRFKRMSGFNVLHPMGWDAFGLPAEQYAIKTGQHPRVTTEGNIAGFRRQRIRGFMEEIRGRIGLRGRRVHLGKVPGAGNQPQVAHLNPEDLGGGCLNTGTDHGRSHVEFKA